MPAAIAVADDGARARLRRHEERRHELRAALFGIEASAHGLARQRTRMASAQLDQLVLALVDEVRRLRNLLDGRAGRMSSFDLSEVVVPVLATVSMGGQQVSTAIRREVVVEGRRESTAQVLVALLDNARHHAPGSPVDVRAATRAGVALLYVEDRGPGMSRGMYERVFERGVCGVQSTGSGFGLFVARRLMVEQGGSIVARPRPGGGTSFVLRFRHVAR